MNSPIPTFVIILIGFVLGILIFGKFAGDMSDSQTRYWFAQTPPVIVNPITQIEKDLELTKFQLVSQGVIYELQMKELKNKYELERIQNTINLEKAKVDAEIERIISAGTVEALNDARIDEEIRFKFRFILQLMNQKSTAKKDEYISLRIGTAGMTTPQIHLNEAQATQKAVQTAIKRSQKAKIKCSIDHKELLSEKIVKETDDLRLKMDIISLSGQLEGVKRTNRKLHDIIDRRESDNAKLEEIIQKENKIGGWHLFFLLLAVIAITIWGVIGYQKTFGVMKKSQVLN